MDEFKAVLAAIDGASTGIGEEAISTASGVGPTALGLVLADLKSKGLVVDNPFEADGWTVTPFGEEVLSVRSGGS